MRFKSIRSGLSITKRTALWSWIVTLMTVVVFAAVIIPQQKRAFQENLESKARGVAVSLRDVTASSAVNEDFSTVVDHCLQMLTGDPALEYIVITKSDGLSLICERSGWRSETQVEGEWRPPIRVASGGIGVVPLFRRRVYHYAHPFDYSGIPWGWIHVGLSLKSYDSSVHAVYQRTIVLAAFCALLSFVGSAFYARRLVKPVLHLRNTVRRIADGDLTARAEILGNDELATLGSSVNTMTEALLRRDRILESVRFAAQQFLTATEWQHVISPVLAQIGGAAEATRASLFENTGNNSRKATCRAAWPEAQREIRREDRPADPMEMGGAEFERWSSVLASGEMVIYHSADLEAAEKQWLNSRELKAAILIPIHAEGAWWGFLCLEDRRSSRHWTEAESSSLRAAADMLGATIARQRTRDALIEAKQTLEDRVYERTRQLEEQVAAKEKARADLAEAQARLMEASRAAGKAEVATSVLHNVGNVLNSVGVSTTIISDRLRSSHFAMFQKAAAMLDSNRANLADFLTRNEKGKLLPGYFLVLSDELAAQRSELLRELEQLARNVEHIKKIVAMQQSYAKVSGALERISAVDLVEDALRMNDAGLAAQRIKVARHFAPELPILNVDRHKVLQILVNLLSNAKHALVASSQSEKELTVNIEADSPGFVTICIKDNGVGIAQENLTRIFQLGFTTRANGHGFGLHSGANAAHELGGRLSAASPGLGLGAEFRLQLPALKSPAGDQSQAETSP